MFDTKLMLRKGFTLVELLIVIALLGAIAVIVIAAINPIEQANKARDARYEADASQMVSAIERYYASNSAFPWMTVDSATYTTAGIEFPYTDARNELVGLCGASCTAQPFGVLISSDELKSNFLSRDFITATATPDKTLLIGKGSGSSSGVYGCFVPAAKSTKDKAISVGKVVDKSKGFSSTGTPTYSSSICQTAEDTGWDGGNCMVCIPQ